MACGSSFAIDHPVLVDSVERRFRSVWAVRIEQRSLGAWFIARHPELAAVDAQINHFNPSAHCIPAEEWRAALAALNQPPHLTPAAELRRLSCRVHYRW